MNIRRFALMPAFIAPLIIPPCPARAGATAEEIEDASSLTSNLVTPHTPWGKGYAGGPMRALFFVYTGPYAGEWEDATTRVRHVVELGQRFDLQADAILFCGKGEKWVFHGLRLGEQRAERLLAKPYQLYVIAGFGMNRLPAKFQYLILKQVAQGAGLLCCGTGAREYMTRKRMIEPTPRALLAAVPHLDGKAASQMVFAYRLGKGRGVWLKYNTQSLTSTPEFSRRELSTYEYRMLLVGRAALWASGRAGEVSIVSVLGDRTVTVRQADSKAGEVVLLNHASGPRQVKVTMAVRRAADGRRTPLAVVAAALAPGKQHHLTVTLPRLRAGDHYLDVIVKSERGVEACGAGAFTVASDYGVESIELNRGFVERDETIEGVISLRGTPPADGALELRLRDSYGRIQKREPIKLVPAKTEYAFKYRADEFATIEMRAEAALLTSAGEVEVKDAAFTVPKRRHGQFNFVMWDAGKDVLGYYAWRQMQRAGYNVCLLGSMSGMRKPPAALLACDASMAPYSTRILDPKDDKGYMQPVCWNDDPAATKYVQGIVDNQRLMREHGVFVYSLGDEGVTKGCCVHPKCLSAYRRYLADQYGSIDRLNQSWGTTYKSFDEVDLLDHADNMENAAAKTNFPRWYDRQAFARYNLMQFSKRFVDAYKRLDPQALTGFEGTGRFGDDYDAILGINEFYGPYPSIGDDIIRSAAPKQLVNSNWMGYSKTGDALSDAAWRMMMKGKNSIWYWMWSGIGRFHGYLRPTFDYWPETADLTEEMRPVKEGLGDLLMRSEMTYSGIAILYSLPSALSSQLGASKQFLNAKYAHETWAQMTYELGLDVRYLTAGMLERGMLDDKAFRVLLLPMTQALSAKQAAIIKQFVERGGTVIADVRPGVFDEHCKPLTPGRLDDLFGIERTGRGKAVDAAVSVQLSLDGRQTKAQLDKVRLDADIKASGGESAGAVGGVPVFIQNRAGKGRALLLNFQLRADEPESPAADRVRQLLQFLYDAAGVQGLVRVASPSGKPLPRTETRIWRNGDSWVIGVWRHMENAWFNPKTGDTAGPPVDARITLPEPREIYDLRAHKHLGRLRRVDAKLRWGRANFYLAAPYKLGALTVTVAPSAPASGQAITATVRLNIPSGVTDRSAVWIEVVDPSGRKPLWAQRVAILDGGRGQARFRCAYNDAPGRWRLRATELFSHQTAEATWKVSG